MHLDEGSHANPCLLKWGKTSETQPINRITQSFRLQPSPMLIRFWMVIYRSKSICLPLTYDVPISTEIEMIVSTGLCDGSSSLVIWKVQSVQGIACTSENIRKTIYNTSLSCLTILYQISLSVVRPALLTGLHSTLIYHIGTLNYCRYFVDIIVGTSLDERWHFILG